MTRMETGQLSSLRLHNDLCDDFGENEFSGPQRRHSAQDSPKCVEAALSREWVLAGRLVTAQLRYQSESDKCTVDAPEQRCAASDSY